MKKVLFFVLALLVLVGCGGGGDDFFGGNDRRFEGFWTGQVFGGNNPAENMSLQINSNGNISGTETVEGRTANISGFVQQDGQFQMTSRLSGTEDVFYSGDMFVNENGRLIGEGTARQGSTTVNMNFNLRRQ